MSSYNITIKRDDKPGIKIGWDVVVEGQSHPIWVEGDEKDLLNFLKDLFNEGVDDYAL
jgi:hypothetical protein